MNDPIPNLVHPPDWSLALGIVGRGLIWLAIALFAFSAVAWLLSPKTERLVRPAKIAFPAGAACLFGAFVVLGILFVTNRLEYNYVWLHGDASNPIQYRIAGIWSGQQGSFLLWACGSALFGLFSVRGTGLYRRWFTTTYAVFLGVLAGILAYETPFGLNLWNGQPVVPASGIGLAPSLLNYWVTIHPPTIFLGFGALTVLGAYAFSALATNNLTDWIPMVRPWAILALTLVGVGLCMGGFWAYETLGWGGFWMWDPVENTSFVPWIFTAAFVHGIMVGVTRKRWTVSNLLLGGLPFILFVYGTFLTRSGVLGDTSVHSFAEMDRVALKLLLGFLVGSSTLFIGMWIWRSVQFSRSGIEPEAPPTGLHREGFYRAGAIFLIVLGLGAAIGMSVPLIQSLRGQAPKVVDEGTYHKVLTWAYVPLMLVMAGGPLVAWRGMGLREFSKRVFGVLCITIGVVGCIMFAVALTPALKGIGTGKDIQLAFGKQVALVPWIVFLVALSVGVVVSNGWRISEVVKRSKMSAAAFLTHVGVACLMTGLIVSRGFEKKEQILVQPGSHDFGLGYLVSLKGQTSTESDKNNTVVLDLKNEHEHFTVSPGLYYIDKDDGQKQAMVWPYIKHYPFHDIYFALQPPVTDAGTVTIPKDGVGSVDGISLVYKKMVRVGNPGQAGTKFGVVLQVEDGIRTRQVTPTMELTPNGVKSEPVDLGGGIQATMSNMDAASGAVGLNLKFVKPVYPVDMFYKPMTILVWLGTGIMLVAGLLSAFYRRKKIEPKEEEQAVAAPTQKPRAKVSSTR